MPSIKGTASVSDARARSKALKSTRFPKNFSKKVNLEKVNKPVLTQWIEQKVTSILGFDDEIVSSTAINLFLPSEGDGPDPRRAQLDLVGFLGEEESASFAKEVWNLMLEAESSNSGIPITLLEKKKKELSQKTAAMNAPGSHPSGRPSQHDNSVVQRNRNPEMNRFVQEAARRAQAARQMVGAPHDVPPGARDAAPVPVPVSPPHPSEKEQNKSSSSSTSDRKMPPRERQRHYRSDMHRPYSYRDAPPFRDGGGGYPPPRGYDDRARRPYPGRMDRSRSRSMDRGRRRDDDRRWDDRRRGSRESDRRWQYDEDREFELLERRLNVLKKQLSNRGDNYALDDEYEDVKDRLYELERRRWRHRREREQEEYRGRTHRRHDDSPPRRGRSPDSPRRRRGSRSPESDRRSRRSGSPGAGGRRGRRRSESSDRRRSRGKSSDSESSRSSSSSGSGHRRRRSPSYDRRRERSRKERDDRRRRSRSHSKSSYSSSGSSRSSNSSDNDNGPH